MRLGEQVLIAYFLRVELQFVIFAGWRPIPATCLNCSFLLVGGNMQIKMPIANL